MDDRKLEGLLKVIETGSLRAAAEELHCTQSAVTQMMNSLEAEFGFRILKRTNKGVTLSEAGARLLPFVVSAHTALQELKKETDLISNGRALPIRLGAFSSISNSWLPDVIAGYRKKHPDIAFDISIATSELPVWLKTGKIDLALGAEDVLKGFKCREIMKDPFFAVLPAVHALAGKENISIDDLSGYTVLETPVTFRSYEWEEEKLRERGCQIIRVETDDDTTLLKMVSKDLGITVVPGLALQNLPDGLCIRPLNPPASRVIAAALPKEPLRGAMDFVRYLISQGLTQN